MRVIVIQIPGNTSVVFKKVIEMSEWLKEQGLTHIKHYDYAIFYSYHEAHFRFYDEHESMGSLFALKWAPI
jgi:hypothetical protein